MQPIDIQITQARIKNFQVSFPRHKDIPDIAASISLMAGEKVIGSFSISTESWGSGIKFELPVDMIEPIVVIARELEVIVVRECTKQLLRLPEPPIEVQTVE